MNEDRLQSPQHSNIRGILRVGGLVVAGLGLFFTLVGVGSFFAAFGSFEPPRYFSCASSVSADLRWRGNVHVRSPGCLPTIRCGADFSPVAKDVFNYMGENVQPGIKAVTKAAAEGVIEAQTRTTPQARWSLLTSPLRNWPITAIAALFGRRRFSSAKLDRS